MVSRVRHSIANSALADGSAIASKCLIGLSLFRLLAGTAMLSEMLVLYGQRHQLFGNKGLISYEEYVSTLHQFSLYSFARTELEFDIAYHGSVLVALLWTLGIATRWLTPCLYVCWSSWLDRGPPIWDGGDNLISILLIYACFADVGAHLGLRSAESRPATSGEPLRAIVHNGSGSLRRTSQPGVLRGGRHESSRYRLARRLRTLHGSSGP